MIVDLDYIASRINRLLLALALITLGILVYKQEDHIGLHDDHPIQGLHYPVGVQTRSRPTHLGYKHGDNLDLIKSTTQKQREDIGQDLSASTTQSNPHYIKFGPPIVTLGDSLTEVHESNSIVFPSLDLNWIGRIVWNIRRRKRMGNPHGRSIQKEI